MKIRLLALLALYVVAVPAMARESLAELAAQVSATEIFPGHGH